MSRCFYLHNEQRRQWIVKVKSLAMTQRPRGEEFQPGLKKALLTPKSLFLPLIHVASQGQDEAGEGSKVRVLCGSAVYSGWKLTQQGCRFQCVDTLLLPKIRASQAGTIDFWTGYLFVEGGCSVHYRMLGASGPLTAQCQ